MVWYQWYRVWCGVLCGVVVCGVPDHSIAKKIEVAEAQAGKMTSAYSPKAEQHSKAAGCREARTLTLILLHRHPLQCPFTPIPSPTGTKVNLFPFPENGHAVVATIPPQ